MRVTQDRGGSTPCSQPIPIQSLFLISRIPPPLFFLMISVADLSELWLLCIL